MVMASPNQYSNMDQNREMKKKLISGTAAFPNLQSVARPIRVLVVEDDEGQWPLWEFIFQSFDLDFKIDWEKTQTGAQALIVNAYQNNTPYDLVISDVFLEDHGSGVDLWNRYGEAVGNFIFVSGGISHQENLEKLLHFGSPTLLAKPINAKQGRRTVLENIEGLRQTHTKKSQNNLEET